MGLLDRTQRLLSVSAFSARKDVGGGLKITSEMVERVREAFGGNLVAPPVTKLEWHLQEVDNASKLADSGDLSQAARLKRAMVRDPIISGLCATKMGGIVRLPKRWSGSAEVIDSLTSKDAGIQRFDLLCPPSEVRAMAEDADFLGVALGEMVPVEGREYRVLERKDPEYLFYRWPTNSWHMRTNAGLLDVTPGDGNWVLHLQGPRIAPWQPARWHSLGRSWVRKDSLQHLKTNWAFKLANAARVAVSPRGSTKELRQGFFRQVASWGINTVFAVNEGWDVKLIESNGRGWEGFDTSIKEANEDFMIGLCGQMVSVTGGTGFSSEDLYANVRLDLIRDCAVPLAYTLSTQVLPAYTYDLFPEEFEASPSFEFEVQKPGDLNAEASILTALGAGLDVLIKVAASAGLGIDVGEFFRRFSIPTRTLSSEELQALRERIVAGEAANDAESKRALATLYTLAKAMAPQGVAA